MRSSRSGVLAALAVALLAALLAVGAVSAAPVEQASSSNRESAKLRKAVNADGILVHERNFKAAAEASGESTDTRSSGTRGYGLSADYVQSKLRRAGYEVTRQRFEFEYSVVESQEVSQTAPQRRTFQPASPDGTGDYAVMTYSGSGEVTDKLVVPTNNVLIPPTAAPSSTSGCEDSDFPASVRGNVALIQRGGCDFSVKAQNAEEAGAVAVLIFNEGQEGEGDEDRTGVVFGTLGGPVVDIPVLGITFELGRELYEARGTDTPRVSLDIETTTEPRTTSNIIADTPTGRKDRTVVVGAHLDSVFEGPGINDNGSGSATILETALQMDRLGIEPRNRVRFAFWGAEEFGLVGSEYYLANLPRGQLDRIQLNLNFDMLGSPNYVRFVYDGDTSSTPPPDGGAPTGSGEIEEVFNDYFDSQDLETEPTAFDGRSDYGPFIERGIPAGGLFSGAEGTKTRDQAATYGGDAGSAYDPCYHQACDNISNLSIRSLNEMSDGVAHATITFANARTLFADGARTQRSSTSVYDEFKGPEAVK